MVRDDEKRSDIKQPALREDFWRDDLVHFHAESFCHRGKPISALGIIQHRGCWGCVCQRAFKKWRVRLLRNKSCTRSCWCGGKCCCNSKCKRDKRGGSFGR